MVINSVITHYKDSQYRMDDDKPYVYNYNIYIIHILYLYNIYIHMPYHVLTMSQVSYFQLSQKVIMLTGQKREACERVNKLW